MDIIKLERVSFAYNNNLVLKNINFSISAGDFVALIGNNGSGKTTLIKLILNLLKSDTGQITILGKDNKKIDYSKISYIPQTGINMFNNFAATIEEFVLSNLYKKIGYFRFAKKEHKKQVDDALSIVNMLDIKHKTINELSGGQKQKMLIARALINDPDIIFLDEPTSGIDVESKKEIYSLLNQLNKKGKTIFMITHDISSVINYINRVFCIEYTNLLEVEKGQIICEIQHKHTHPETQA